MMNYQSSIGMASLVQKIGKGKRKHNVKFEKHNLKFLSKFAIEMKKQMAVYGDNPQAKSMISFFEYLEKEGAASKGNILFSYEELEFLKMTISSNMKQIQDMQFKWYQFFKKLQIKLLNNQYTMIMKDLNK